MNIKLTVLLALLLSTVNGWSQQAAGQGQQKPSKDAKVVAKEQVQRLQDSLQLTGAKRKALYDFHLKLIYQKTQARQQHKGNPEATRLALQKIENSKDSLYKIVLSDAEYRLYQQKKRNIIRAGM